jgi:hypothetical protein
VAEPFDSEALAANALQLQLTARESADIATFSSVVSPIWQQRISRPKLILRPRPAC